ncbi:MAG: HEPN domain-containing protein [bacterium]
MQKTPSIFTIFLVREKFFMKRNSEEIKLISDWLTFAKENLLFARAGMKEDFSPYHTICFLCQGSAEKYLKAFLISKGWELKKIHDLTDLLNDAAEYDEDFKELLPLAKILNQYITEGRYPGDLPFESISEKDAIEAIEAAEAIEKLVLSKIDLTDEAAPEENDHK